MDDARMRRPVRGMLLPALLAASLCLAQDPGLPTATSSLFSGSGNCAFCHDGDGATLVDSQGTDLSIARDWRATMMGHSSKDPVWQAAVESEVTENPGLQAAIEDKCATCHAPMGRTQAIFDGHPAYGLDEVRSSALALDGVSCTLCHQIQSSNLGTPGSYSGNYLIDDSRRIFGPYANIFARPMENRTGYTPLFGAHVSESALCATCHTLYTPSVDAEGNVVGIFPEQMPYLEWLNSAHSGEGTECQTCHMPRVDEPIVISNRPPALGGHSPFFRHVFVGGNTFALQLIGDNAVELGITATRSQIDSKIDQTRERLGEGAVRLTADASVREGLLVVEVDVENLTGHKFPTGFPSRRAWLRVVVETEDGETVFASGAHDAQGRIVGRASGFEPHHDRIDRQDQVQIYEPVMERDDGETTFVLLRAARYRKDNRLPPRGFVSTVPYYGDIAVAGAAAADDDFNRDGETEGTGRDRVTYEIDVSGRTGRLRVSVALLYQTISPEFAEYLRGHDTAAASRFARMYDGAAKDPETTQSVALEVSAGGPVPFRRGDTNADGRQDISDAMFLLVYLFNGGRVPPCLRAGDVDAGGGIDIADAVYLLRYLFAGETAPPAPFPGCGTDAGGGDLTCLSYPPCE